MSTPPTTRIDATPDRAPEAAADDVQARRSYKLPVTFAVGTLLALFMALSADGETTVRLATGNEAVSVPDFTVAAAPVCFVLAVLAAGLTALSVKFARDRRPIPAWLSVLVLACVVLTFFMWAGAGTGRYVTLTQVLATGLALATPLVFGAMAGVICERVGIVNIAIEGQLLAGAFLAAVVATMTGSAYVGLLAAPVAGALVGVLLVLFSVTYRVDQIIVGVVLNVLVTGFTAVMFGAVLTDSPETFNSRTPLPSLPIPLLSEIPVIGPVLFNQTILVYLMYAVVILLNLYLFRSRWGLRLRAVGEHPKAADTVGINVNRTRWWNAIFGSAMAGLGGAYFTIGSGLAFGTEMSGGNGYIALAAMILGRWTPTGALVAALLFGFARSVALLLPSIGASLPSEFMNMIPYLVTILAVAGFVGKVRAPAAENIPYVKS